MADSGASPSPPPVPVAVGCSFGCASWFLLVGVLWPLSLMLAGEFEGGEQSMLSFLLGGPALVVGSILALAGVFSPIRRGRRWALAALTIMWAPVAALLVFVGVGGLFGWR